MDYDRAAFHELDSRSAPAGIPLVGDMLPTERRVDMVNLIVIQIAQSHALPLVLACSHLRGLLNLFSVRLATYCPIIHG